MPTGEGWLVLTNDDGIEAPGFEMLVKALHAAGHPVVTFAPKSNHSAAGMRIQLGSPMPLRERHDLVEDWGLTGDAPVRLFELDGTPCDTMIVALDGGLAHVAPDIRPRLVVSGVNLGPNLSQDSYHSGTMGAAREAGLYGMPAVASSFTSFEPEGMQRAVDATVMLVERVLPLLPDSAVNLRRPTVDLSAAHVSSWPHEALDPAWSADPAGALLTAFQHGEVMLNLNVGPDWDGSWKSTRLGTRWYRDAVSFDDAEEGDVATFRIGAASIDHSVVEDGDCDAVDAGAASLSSLPTWPATHPFALEEALLAQALRSGEDGWPLWLTRQA
jgi:broad specificity polyphosphatase/5'/3'-nucleotidase SurE